MGRTDRTKIGLCLAVVGVAAFVAVRKSGRAADPEPAARPEASAPVKDARPPPEPAEAPPHRSNEPKPDGGGSLLAGLPSAGLASKVYPIDEQYDSRHDLTSYSVTNLKTDREQFTLLSVRWMQPGAAADAIPTSVHFTISTKGETWKLRDSYDVSILVDGRQLTPLSVKHEGHAEGGHVLEYVAFTLATQDCLDLANAKTESGMKVGIHDVRIGPEERKAILSLATKFPKAAKKD